MKHDLSFVYLACQTCQAKIHCDECEEKIVCALRQKDGIDTVTLSMKTKQALVEGNADLDDVEIMFEDLGLFLE